MEWITRIFGLIGPFLAECQKKNNPTQTPAEAQADLRAQYNAMTGRMNPRLVRQVVPQVRRAENKARRNGTKQERKDNPRLTKDQLYDMADKSLIQAMAADKAQLRVAYAAAAKLGDDD